MIRYNISPSALNLYNESELQFFFRYIEKRQPDTKTPQCYGKGGTIVHDIIDTILISPKIKEHWRNIFVDKWSKENLFSMPDVKGNPLSQKEYEESVVTALNLLENKYTPIKSEVEIILPYLNNGRFNINFKGIIDLVAIDKTTNKKVVVDWKTSNSKDNDKRIPNEPFSPFEIQGLFYAWLLYKKEKIVIDEVIFEYIKIKQDKSFKITIDKIKAFEKYLFNKAKEIVEKSNIIDNFNVGNIEGMFNEYKKGCNEEKVRRLSKQTLVVERGKDNVCEFKTKIYDSRLLKALREKYSYEVPNSSHSDKFKQHIWDGKKYLFQNNKFPLGFINNMKNFLKKFNDKFKTNYEIILKQPYLIESVIKTKYNAQFKERKITPRYYQKDAKDVAIEEKIGIIYIGTGGGKCFGKDTKVMMYDSSIKNVQDIKKGDILMGDDGTPRNVLNICSGYERLYEIQQKRADNYIVNESHILSVTPTINFKKYKKDKIYDIDLKNYITQNNKFKHCMKGVKPKILNFHNKEILDIDPYWLGLWLGDGSSIDTSITCMDVEVQKYISKYAEELKLKFVISEDKRNNNCNSYKIISGRGNKPNKLLNKLKKYNLIKNKHIPHKFKFSSVENRRKILAGIIDTDGSNHNNCVDITLVNKQLFDDVVFIGRSLGLACRIKERLINNKIYYRCCFSGDTNLIPTLIPRKIFVKRIQKKRQNVTGIKIKKLKIGKYYGFVIDGNNRFLLSDFTIVHNTVIATEIIRELDNRTLFLVNNIELLNQTAKNFEEHLGIKIGTMSEGNLDVENQVTVASIQTIIAILKRKDETTRKLLLYLYNVNTVIYDEAQNLKSMGTKKVVKKDGSSKMIKAEAMYGKLAKTLTNATRFIGLTGTPYRTTIHEKVYDDGDINVLKKSTTLEMNALIGFVIYAKPTEELEEEGFISPCECYFIEYFGWNEEFGVDFPDFYKKNIVHNEVRNKIAIDLIEKIRKKYKTIILVRIKEHGKLLNSLIENSYFISGETEKELRKENYNDFVNNREIILIGMSQIFSAGIDIPDLDMVIDLTSKKSDVDVIQVIGRSKRNSKNKKCGYYIDFVDNMKYFDEGYKIRQHILRERKNKVEQITFDKLIEKII